MATRIYKDPADFDLSQAHFTIEGVDSRYYLKIGALNSEDQRLIASLIEDGFVGFFQDEVRIAIAGIASRYDATNDRIEIDRELPELKIEDAYVIRFTQARPGEGGIGTPGEDGRHAEIEVEDTNTGIRVRGKSGGEPDFGPWQDVRDGRDGAPGRDGRDGAPGRKGAPGRDGTDGQPGQDGNDGEDGEHAEIEVEDTNTGIRVRGKSGGEPDFGPWQDIRDGRDGAPGRKGAPGRDGRDGAPGRKGAPGRDGTDGQPGRDGNDGEDGKDGWSPKFATVSDGERRVLQVADWFGGGGTKPNVGQYVGEAGFVADIADGVDIRGPAGEDGEDGTGICTAHTVLNDPTGTQNRTQIELPANYTDYDNVYIEGFDGHIRANTIKIATLVDRRIYRIAADTRVTWNATDRTFTLQAGGGNFRHVLLTGCEDDGGSSNDGEDGWSPKFAIKSDGERRVLQVADWFGGGGTKPITGKYIGLNSFVDAITDGVDIRGSKGQDGGKGPPGPQGPPGRDGADGLSDTLFSNGNYSPTVPQLIWKIHGDTAGWRSGGINVNHINITNAGGRWLRWGNEVLVFGCFNVSVGQHIAGGLDELRVYLSLPQGSKGSGGHGIGTPLGASNLTFTLHGDQDANNLAFTPWNNGSEERVAVVGNSVEDGYSHKFGAWVPINPGLGDYGTRVTDFSQQPTEGTTNNSLRIVLRDPSGIGNKFNGLHGFSMIYRVTSA